MKNRKARRRLGFGGHLGASPAGRPLSYPQPDTDRPRLLRSGSLASERIHGDDGTALIEFALVLPFLFTLIFGVMDIGRIYYHQHRLTNMAREGSNYGQWQPLRVNAGATPCDGVNSIEARGRNEDLALGFKNPALGPAVSNFNANLSVRVQVKDPVSGTWTQQTGCSTNVVATGTIAKVEARLANFDIMTPFMEPFFGSTITLSGSSEVDVQGKKYGS